MIRIAFERLAWAYVAFIWLMSLIPLSMPAVPNSDKIGHFLAYGLLALWFGLARQQKLPLIWFTASLMGVAIEFAQALTPYRSFDLKDMLANACGALIGTLLAAFLLRLLPHNLRIHPEKP
ncbi:VanZ family protein [Iodobacter ciconiae]|uniref:VanZ family protein n=1 Tax=Iodobacter ciconiae TaxID=2496266 RepID=A0A3S8ZRM1_9NEIS|nr:VanZ family protein [Iodobacter ciconiae]AZN36117.1 VanZ family protein [Iodobacter ciconiae]